MGFEIAQYQRGLREARGLFTGGADSLLAGGPKTPVEVIDKFIKANEARFNVQKNMLKNLEAADILGADEDEIFKEFRDRQLRGDYRDLSNDIFESTVNWISLPNSGTGVCAPLVSSISSAPASTFSY